MKRVKQAGFTLIELVVVMVILGILAAVAIPQFLSVQSSAYAAVEESACSALTSQATILYASNRAVPGQAALNTAKNGMTLQRVTIADGVGCVFTVTATGNTSNTACTVPATLCSGP